MGNSIQLIMKTVSTYEVVSDQLVNRDKSHFMIPYDAPIPRRLLASPTKKSLRRTLYIGRHILVSGNFASNMGFYSASLGFIHTPLPL